MYKIKFLPLCILLFVTAAQAQSRQDPDFDLDDYSAFLEANQNLSAEQLSAEYPLQHDFKSEVSYDNRRIAFLDSIRLKYELTQDELSLLHKNGFVVSQRLQQYSFGHALLDVYKKDLPVFVSTDAILFALHMSYDAILKELEYALLIPKLETALELMHQDWPLLEHRFGSIPEMQPCLNDIDVYITVARSLLAGTSVPPKGDNNETVSEILNLIEAEQPTSYPLFNETRRTIDFSQFKPRGHYTESEVLKNYFKAMIWLGRTQMRLTQPVDHSGAAAASVSREIIDAYLVLELAEESGAFELLKEIDRVIEFLVGKSDNVTLTHLQKLAEMISLDDPAELLEKDRVEAFQEALDEQPFAIQRINSQILFSDPMSTEPTQPPSAFLLLGQRFVVDSYIAANVVYDRIIFNGSKVWRDLPSGLDILFALGNNTVLPLLRDELETFHYASNLNALRFLVDAYDESFWSQSFYNMWLGAIRSLNQPETFDALPEFMQTGAWQQQKMNTQLAAWAELRHDNLLYAKQSYTAGITCSYPQSYIEPYPELYLRIKALALRTDTFLNGLELERDRFSGFFQNMAATLDTLATIAQKELDRHPFTRAEKAFLRKMLFEIGNGCQQFFSGWYPKLFFSSTQDVGLRDLIVADVHTAPTDAAGNMIGKVLHAGTGYVDLGIFTAEGDSGLMAYVGPVLSYHEHVTLNFNRLSDPEWKQLFRDAPPLRPDWVNVYLADKNGRVRPQGPQVVTSVDEDQSSTWVPDRFVLRQNYPNPFNAGTLISFDVPHRTATDVSLDIYNIRGEKIKTLVHRPLAPGTYAIRWNGSNGRGIPAASGIYIYKLQIGDLVETRKMTILK